MLLIGIFSKETQNRIYFLQNFSMNPYLAVYACVFLAPEKKV